MTESVRPADRDLDYASMSTDELRAELADQRERLERLISEGQRRAVDEASTLYADTAAQLRELLRDGIDPDHAQDILEGVADLFEAEALMERKIGPLTNLIFGAVAYSGDYPVLFEANDKVIKATPTFHLLAIADTVLGLEDAAAKREAQDEERAQAGEEAAE